MYFKVAASTVAYLGIHVCQAVSSELVEQTSVLQMLYDHVDELRVAGREALQRRADTTGHAAAASLRHDEPLIIMILMYFFTVLSTIVMTAELLCCDVADKPSRLLRVLFPFGAFVFTCELNKMQASSLRKQNPCHLSVARFQEGNKQSSLDCFLID